MNRKQLISELRKRANEEVSPGFTSVEVEIIVERLLELIVDRLKENKPVRFRGFGSFKPVDRAPRTYNVHGSLVECDSRRTVVFKPSKKLRALLEEDVSAS